MPIFFAVTDEGTEVEFEADTLQQAVLVADRECWDELEPTLPCNLGETEEEFMENYDAFSASMEAGWDGLRLH